MRKTTYTLVACLSLVFCCVHLVWADTEIDGTATSSTSFTLNGVVNISTLTVSSATIISATLQNLLANLSMNGYSIANLADGVAGSDAAAFKQVKILQVLIGTSTIRTTTTSTSFTQTALSVNITPSSSNSLILLWASASFTVGNIEFAGDATFERYNSSWTNLGGANGFVTFGGASSATSSLDVPASMIYLDSPSTTSTITYSVFIKNESGGITVGWGEGPSDKQIIVVAEVNGL